MLGRQQVDYSRGLSAAEAQSRLVRYGPNTLPEPKRRSRLAILFGQFNSLLDAIAAACRPALLWA